MAISISKGVYVFDIEADNLLEHATKIHCLSIGKITKSGNIKIVTTDDYDVMRDFFTRKDITKVGHNIIRYDVNVAEKLLDIKVPTSNLIDTLPLSWYLYPKNHEHGLEYWGQVLETEKVSILDWQNGTFEEYKVRCETDVMINYKLWMQQKDYLLKIYKSDEAVERFIEYSNFKSLCVRVQEKIGLRFDMEKAQSVLADLEKEREEKFEALAKVMPPQDVTGTKTIPKEMYKKDGTMTKKWQEWLEFKRQYGIPDDWNEPVTYVKGSKPGNPGSPAQIKDWLYALGWEPCTFSYTRNKETNEFKQVPQIYNKDTGEITASVQRLVEKEPGIEELNGLGKVKHRTGLVQGLIDNAVEVEEGHYRIYPSISGYTNTLRLRHSITVNLPKVGLFKGEEIRGLFIADEGHQLCGADLSNIESVTRNHYIFPLDPDYVLTMQGENFDSHIDIAVLANMMSKEDGEWYVDVTKRSERGEYHLTDEDKERLKPLKKARSVAKNCNFASVYGVSAKTLSRNYGLSIPEAKRLIDIYWQRNWSVKEFADNLSVKEVNGQLWIQNPVSKFWLTLRSDKDRFSTVNQSTATFVMDSWLRHTMKLKVKVAYQCHDEMLFNFPEGQEDYIRELLNYSISKTNEELQLNVTIGMAPAFGNSYADCH